MYFRCAEKNIPKNFNSAFFPGESGRLNRIIDYLCSFEQKKESIMIKRKEEMETIYPEHVCNGLGSIEKKFVFSTEEMLDKAKMFARITLPDGSSIGEHPHQPEAEIYYILEGEVVVTDNDRQEILHPGDAVFTGNGDRHSVTNASGKPAVLMAVILW